MKKFVSLLFIALISATIQAKPTLTTENPELNKLLDGFSNAIVKKDKVWLEANLSANCLMNIPGTGSFDKQKIIFVFTEGVYNVSKSVFMNQKFTVDGTKASGNAAMEVEGTMSVEGRSEDISSVYIFDLKFKKVDAGWQISEIEIKEDK
jgi:hypothetical protein